ncbi:MAG TPA: hypothetical protein VFI73_00190 [Candidatus Nitrosopolaris sp.]|nr:hypothetical protein [Candidatus Nitrosopolaris sp.]
MKKCCKLNFQTPASSVGITVVSMLLFSLWIANSWIETTYAVALPNKAEVKITSPSKGQQVPSGGILVSGTSSANATTDCTVSVIINGIRPYQRAVSTGHGGTNDYSNWTFTTTQKYTAIKQGQNKITAKMSCPENLNFTKFYSVNVTGVAGKAQQLANSTTTTGFGFPPSLPSVATATNRTLASSSTPGGSSSGSTVGGTIVKEPKHSEILKSSK